MPGFCAYVDFVHEAPGDLGCWGGGQRERQSQETTEAYWLAGLQQVWETHRLAVLEQALEAHQLPAQDQMKRAHWLARDHHFFLVKN